MTDKVVSIIVVTYNQERTIARALDSVLAQDFALPYEIVVGDDASTDGTRDILQDYRRRYPDIIRLRFLPCNRGVRENYITCLLDCNGKYIADCAGDDFWTDTTRLSRQYRLLEDNPDISLVHTAWDYFDETTGERHPGDPESKRLPYCPPLVDGRELLAAIIGHVNDFTVHLCTSMYRFDRFIESYVDDPDLFRYPRYTCEDLQLTAVMAASGLIAYMPESTLCYSVGHDSVSHARDRRREFDYFWGAVRLTRHLQRKYQIDDKYVAPYYERVVNHMAAIALGLDDPTLLDDIKRLDVDVPLKARLLGNKGAWQAARIIKKMKR